MAFELPALPYAMNALEPYISERTMEFHYGKHHKAYVDNLNKLIAGTHFEQMSLEEIIRKTAGKTEYAGFEVIVVPTILVDEPVTLVGMGDTISSISLVGSYEEKKPRGAETHS